MQKILSLLALLVLASWACTSDCTSCHPSLDTKNDKRHAPLASCITCHPPEQLEQTTPMAGCGTDCFKCHDANRLTNTSQHRVIKECIACHKGMVEPNFILPPDFTPQNFGLKNMLTDPK